MRMTDRIQHAYNAFMNKDPTSFTKYSVATSYSSRPDRMRFSRGNERSIVTSVFNRIALDVASITIEHVQLDDDGRFSEIRHTGLNECLTTEANIDQTGRAFIQDVAQSMMDEGCVAIIPVDTTDDPELTGSYDINSIRTGKILEWMPAHVRVRVYNDRIGEKREIILPKQQIGIVENPFFTVMNEPNSTVQRLIRKLNILDSIDEQSGSGKLD